MTNEARNDATSFRFRKSAYRRQLAELRAAKATPIRIVLILPADSAMAQVHAAAPIGGR